MAVLFAATEIEAFSGTPVAIDGATGFDATYSRSALRVRIGNEVYVDLDVGPTFTFRARVQHTGSMSSLGNRVVDFEFGGSSYLRFFVDTGFTGIWLQDGGTGVQILSLDDPPVNGTAYVLTIEVTVHPTAGSLAVYYDDERVGAVSGIDTQGDNAGTSFDRIKLANHRTGTSYDTYWSEVIVTDGESPLGWRLVTLPPASAGALQEWDGSTAAINLTSAGASNLVSASAGEFFTWAHAETFDANRKAIKAVILSAAHSLDGSGPSRLRAVQRIGGTNYEAASAGASAAAAFIAVMTSSLDGSPWDAAKINSSQFGWESVA